MSIKLRLRELMNTFTNKMTWNNRMYINGLYIELHRTHDRQM